MQLPTPFCIGDKPYFPYISINTNYSSIYFEADSKKTHHNNENSSKNLLCNSTYGFLSDVSKKKIKKAINLLLYISNYRYTGIVATKKDFKFKITFITLTLPAQQKHSDKEITNVCLHHFLNELRKHWNLEHYVWKAEKQKNGNIHYHLTTNIYIHYMDLRELWIKSLNKLNYISEYQKNMKNFHKQGFKVRTELLDTWSYEAQKTAYEYGKKTDWKSPNCTDVHSVINIKNLAAYISEYFTKNPLNEYDTEIYKECIKSISTSKRTIKLLKAQIKENKHYTKDYVKTLNDIIKHNENNINIKNEQIAEYSKLFVSGRIWFLSRSLSGFKCSIALEGDEVTTQLEQYLTKNPTKLVSKDYISLIYADLNELYQNGCTGIKQEFDKQLSEHMANKNAEKEKRRKKD